MNKKIFIITFLIIILTVSLTVLAEKPAKLPENNVYHNIDNVPEENLQEAPDSIGILGVVIIKNNPGLSQLVGMFTLEDDKVIVVDKYEKPSIAKMIKKGEGAEDMNN